MTTEEGGWFQLEPTGGVTVPAGREVKLEVRLFALQKESFLDLARDWPVDALKVHDSSGGSLKTIAKFKGLRAFEAIRAGPVNPFEQADELAGYLGAMPFLREIKLSGFGEATDKSLISFAGIQSLEAISLDSAAMTDASLARLKKLPRLRWLRLDGPFARPMSVEPSAFSDSAFTHIKAMPMLQDLWIGSPEFTDATLAQARGMDALRGIQLSNPGVTAKGLADLAACPRLEELALWNASLKESDLALLEKIPTLRRLSLGNMTLTRRGLETLGRIRWLERLSFNRIIFNEENLPALRELSFLSALEFNDCPVGDEIIPILQNFFQLRTLDLVETRVTGKRLGQINANRFGLPKCRVNRRPSRRTTTPDGKPIS